MTIESSGTLAREDCQLVRAMLDDMTVMGESLAETELELLEGLRVLAPTIAVCSEISVDIDTTLPWFFQYECRDAPRWLPEPQTASTTLR